MEKISLTKIIVNFKDVDVIYQLILSYVQAFFLVDLNPPNLIDNFKAKLIKQSILSLIFLQEIDYVRLS